MSRFRMPYGLDQDFFHIARALNEQNVRLIAEAELLKEKDYHGRLSRLWGGLYFGLLLGLAVGTADSAWGTWPGLTLVALVVAIPAYFVARHHALRREDA